MLVRVRENALRSTFNLIRELLLIFAFGALGGQLLIALNGGAPIGSEALAATNLSAQPAPRIASLEFDLDPNNPAMVSSVFLELGAAHHSAIKHLHLSPTTASTTQYDCHVETPATWHCPTPGLRLVELERVVLTSP
jgi:hypothetical protein